MRVVEVWLDDEFKEYFYTREPTIRGYDIGDISAQLQFKRDHKCKSFKWFMDNVAYEVYDKFPPPPANVAWGEVSSSHVFCHVCRQPSFKETGSSVANLSNLYARSVNYDHGQRSIGINKR